jgi:hypothetical protein
LLVCYLSSVVLPIATLLSIGSHFAGEIVKRRPPSKPNLSRRLNFTASGRTDDEYCSNCHSVKARVGGVLRLRGTASLAAAIALMMPPNRLQSPSLQAQRRCLQCVSF